VLVLRYSNHPATGTGRLLDLPLRGGGFRRLPEGVGIHLTSPTPSQY